MAHIVTKLFTNSLLNSSDCCTLSQLAKSVFPQYSSENGNSTANLNVFIVVVLLFCILVKIVLAGKPKHAYISYADTLPYMQWIPFVKLPLLDGLIFWYRLRKDGLKSIFEVLAQCGPNFKLSLGPKTIIAISDPNTIQTLLSSTKSGHLSRPELLHAEFYTRLLRDGLLASKMDTWSTHRKVLSQAFKYKSLVSKEMADCESACNATTEKTSGVLYNKKFKEIIDFNLTKMVTNIIMGPEFLIFSEDQINLFHTSFKTLKEIAVERLHKPELFLPFIWWLHPNSQTMEQSIDTTTKIATQITDNYRKKMEVKDEYKERVNSQNSFRRKDDDESIGIKPAECPVEVMIKSGLNNKEISDEVATLLIAGYDTIKIALDLLIFHLAGNQEHQKKCQTEIDEMFNSKVENEDDHLEMAEFSKLKYLEMCILEGLRLTPPIPVVARELQEPLKVDNKSLIPAGRYVMVMLWMLHRNPSIYPNPDTFDPSRFLPDNVKQRHPYSFIPFSMGMRNCIGYKLALMELKVIMAWILRYFEMDTTDQPNDVKMHFGITLELERPYNVTFKRRM